MHPHWEYKYNEWHLARKNCVEIPQSDDAIYTSISYFLRSAVTLNSLALTCFHGEGSKPIHITSNLKQSQKPFPWVMEQMDGAQCDVGVQMPQDQRDQTPLTQQQPLSPVGPCSDTCTGWSSDIGRSRRCFPFVVVVHSTTVSVLSGLTDGWWIGKN